MSDTAWAPAHRRVTALAMLAASALATACRPGETPRSAPAPRIVPTGTSPTVRVGLVLDTAAVTVSSPADFELRTAGATVHSANGEQWTVRLAGGGDLEARTETGRTLRSEGPLVIRSIAGDRIEMGGRAYRGELIVRADRDGVTAINAVDLELYLLGVVPREIGRRPAQDMEAVKAQAVAARTYAIGNLGSRQSMGFDYFASVQDQVYGGVPDEDSIATRAVFETRGEIVTYQGLPILAYYSSTCGGRTAAIEESWPWRSPLPYLKSVSDGIPGTDEYYCGTSNRFRWSASWTRAQLLATLGETLRAFARSPGLTVRTIRAVEITGRGESGRTTLRLTTDTASYTLRADSLRWVLRTPAGAGLNSSYLHDVEFHESDDTAAAALTVHGGGWGHGIGMCQVGALGRARKGQKYDQILRTYYAGTEIARIY